MNTFLRQEGPGPCPWWTQVPQMWLLDNALIFSTRYYHSTKTGASKALGHTPGGTGGGAHRALQEVSGSHIKDSLSFVPSVFSVCAFPWHYYSASTRVWLTSHTSQVRLFPTSTHSLTLRWDVEPPSPLCPQGLKHPSASHLGIEMQAFYLFSRWVVNTFNSRFLPCNIKGVLIAGLLVCSPSI